MLSERHLQEKDIEDPLARQSEDLRSSQLRSSADDHSDSSDVEQEQDFVSSVVTQRQGPRVHWGDLPKHKSSKGEQVMVERQKSESNGNEEEVEGQRTLDTDWEEKRSENTKRQESQSCQTGSDADAAKHKRLHSDEPNMQQVSEEVGLSEEPAVEEAMSKLNLCSLPETRAAPLPAESAPTLAVPLTSPPCKDSAESKPLPSAALTNMNQDGHMTALTNLHITQVGMSKRGAAGLRDLVKKHSAGAEPDSTRLNLLECLQRTLKDWCTEATLTFLYGTSHSPDLTPLPDVGEEKEVELDEDDLADEDAQGIDAGVPSRASAPVPDFKTLREETQQLELRVKGFYKGTWVLPEKMEEAPGSIVSEGRRKGRHVVIVTGRGYFENTICNRLVWDRKR